MSRTWLHNVARSPSGLACQRQQRLGPTNRHPSFGTYLKTANTPLHHVVEDPVCRQPTIRAHDYVSRYCGTVLVVLGTPGLFPRRNEC
jgi:hypothetical protein